MSHGTEQAIARLEQRLKGKLPGKEAHELMMARVVPMPRVVPDDARPSAVLILLFPEQDELRLVLIKRTEDGRAHSGQISFPGGRQDPTDADLRATALREAQEEIGAVSADVRILGQLTPLYIPVSNFQVYPFVGYLENKFPYNLSRDEVAEVLEVRIDRLFSPASKNKVSVTSPAVPDVTREVNAYILEDGSVIWGATAMILSELEALMA